MVMTGSWVYSYFSFQTTDSTVCPVSYSNGKLAITNAPSGNVVRMYSTPKIYMGGWSAYSSTNNAITLTVGTQTFTTNTFAIEMVDCLAVATFNSALADFY